LLRARRLVAGATANREDEPKRIKTMATNFAGSAKIYSFPPRGRFLGFGNGEGAAPRLQPAVVIASGSGWYHEEAVRDARKVETLVVDPRRKN